MPRTKGSKTRKSVILSVADVTKQIAEQEAAVAAVKKELDSITAAIKEQQLLARNKKKELHKAEKTLATLNAKKEECATIEAAAAQKAEIESVVTKLISSGKTAEEILAQLK